MPYVANLRFPAGDTVPILATVYRADRRTLLDTPTLTGAAFAFVAVNVDTGAQILNMTTAAGDITVIDDPDTPTQKAVRILLDPADTASLPGIEGEYALRMTLAGGTVNTIATGKLHLTRTAANWA